MHTTPDPESGSRLHGQARPDVQGQRGWQASPERLPGPRRHLARLTRTLVGVLLLIAGAAMLVLPGPGLLAIVAGLTLLAVDYVWARRLLATARRRLDTAGRSMAHRMRRSRD